MFPKILVWTWTDPATPSGSPALLGEILKWIPKGHAEVVCESRDLGKLRRKIDIEHPITRYGVHKLLWPFRRGSRQIRLAKYLVLPITLLFGLWRIFRFKPDCLLTIYFNEQWILTSYCLSKLTGIPVVYYVHDPFEERARHEGTLSARFARWLEPRSLKHGEVLVICDSLRDLYARKYGITAAVLRHSAPDLRPKLRDRSVSNAPLRIGFAGAIYDNNKSLLRQLVAECAGDPRVQLRIWTDARPDVLDELGLTREGIQVSFESEYGRLIEHLSNCDLLYLPLAFSDTPTLPTDSLRYAFPTKTIDYLIAGTPILAHCPPDYETSLFLAKFNAAYSLNTDGSGELRAWKERWLANSIEPLSDSASFCALEVFSPSINMTKLMNFLDRITGAQSVMEEHASDQRNGPACASADLPQLPPASSPK
ncbi:MAG: a-glycosyltransferase [Acidobacteria bacterium]|nr:a-glycosyltransferase [Acidobacteriota bacterium]